MGSSSFTVLERRNEVEQNAKVIRYEAVREHNKTAPKNLTFSIESWTFFFNLRAYLNGKNPLVHTES